MKLNKLIRIVIVELLIIIGTYLGGAFISADFDFRHWDMEGRFLCLAIVAMASAAYITQNELE